MNNSLDHHRAVLKEMYKDQIQDAGPFTAIVLKEAIIEDWVVKLEKCWRTI